MKQVIGIAGGTGFVGGHIAGLLRQAGHEVIIFTRSPRPPKDGITYAAWDPDRQTINADALGSIDVMINLAGAGVADKRWTSSYKNEIIHSRVDATHFLHAQIARYAPGCRAFVAASATGYYGPDRKDAQSPFTEEAPRYDDFLGQVCAQWEAATFAAQSSYRTVALRIGIVLGREGGAYPRLAQPMSFGVVPILGGSGRQVVSWIHVADLAAIFVKAALDTPEVPGTGAFRGIYNAVAPQPVIHRELMNAIARAKGGLKIPVPVPPFMLQAIMGEASIEVLKSCTVSSEKLQAAGYSFLYPTIAGAVASLHARL